MNYPDNFKGTNMDASPAIEQEHADEELQLIVDYKRELFAYLVTPYSGLKAGAVAMRPYMEEAFDEAFCKRWHELTAISGSIGWPTNIPPFETLSFETPQQIADKEQRQAAFRPQPTRGCGPTNHATLAALGVKV